MKKLLFLILVSISSLAYGQGKKIVLAVSGNGSSSGTSDMSAYELLINKATGFGVLNDVKYPTTNAVATYITSLGYLTTEADPKRVVSLAFTGTITKTLTLTMADATTVFGTFTDVGSSRVLEVTAVGTLMLDYSKDYVFTGSTTIYTLPAIDVTKTGYEFSIYVKNRGTGNVTINSNAGSTIYGAFATGTISISAGESIMFLPDGTYFLIK